MVSNNKLAYELYCRTCLQTVAYTNHKFIKGELMSADDHYINDPEGRRQGPGDPVARCKCGFHVKRFLGLRANPNYLIPGKENK